MTKTRLDVNRSPKKCKVCGRTALSGQFKNGDTYRRTLCGTCKNRKYKHKKYSEGLSKNLYLCERCGWKGFCDIHHKNGNHNDNNVANLEILCPNCHRSYHYPFYF